MANVEQAKKNLYLQDIFNESSPSSPVNPSSLCITIPRVGSDGRRLSPVNLYGLIATEPTISTANKWGPILNDVSMLSFFAALSDMRSIPSWIGASAQCWKGTDPIRINLDFYLINYSASLNLEEKLRELTKLTSLSLDPNSFTSVFVHGGYKVNALSNNASRFDNTVANNRNNGQPNIDDAIVQRYAKHDITGLWGELISKFNSIPGGKDGVGTVAIKIGNKFTLDKLLVVTVNVTPSIVEVCSSGVGGVNPKPLYYHVTTSMIGCRPLISEDVDNMY